MEQRKLPRPLGLTHMSLQYQKTGAQEDKDKILRYLMQQYIMDGLHYQGQSMNLQQLSHAIKVPLNELYPYMAEGSRTISGLVQADNLGSTLETLAAMSIQATMDNYGKARNQFDILNIAQGGTYKPFISAEVNKAMKNLFESTKSIGDTYSSFFKDTSTKINIFQPKETEDAELVTTEEALNMLNAPGNSKPLKEDEAGMKALFEEYNIEDDTPEVNYNAQNIEGDKNTFLKLTPAGIPLGDKTEEAEVIEEITEKVLAEPPKKAKRKRKKSHENRRELEENLDQDKYLETKE